MYIVIFIIFIWIGGFKFVLYEVEGIVFFVVNFFFFFFMYKFEKLVYK